jgi:uncharacterized protein (DUF4415 family)
MKKARERGRTSRPDAENPEVTAEAFAKARPAAEMLPRFIGAKATDELVRRGRGRPAKEVKKVSQNLRLDPDVLQAYKASGSGWQTRINQLLREHMPTFRK